MRCKVNIIPINLQCCKDKSDEDSGDKAPNKCPTKEHESLFLESLELIVIGRPTRIGMVRDEIFIGILVRVSWIPIS